MLDQARQDKARECARIQRRLFWLGLALGLAFLLALLLGGLSRELREAAHA